MSKNIWISPGFSKQTFIFLWILALWPKKATLIHLPHKIGASPRLVGFGFLGLGLRGLGLGLDNLTLIQTILFGFNLIKIYTCTYIWLTCDFSCILQSFIETFFTYYNGTYEVLGLKTMERVLLIRFRSLSSFWIYFFYIGNLKFLMPYRETMS